MNFRRAVSAPWRGMKSIAGMTFQRESWRSILLPGLLRGFKDRRAAARESSAVMAPIQWILRTFPEAQIQVEKLNTETGQHEPVHGHDLAQLLTRPNPYYTGRTLWMAMLADYLIDGNAYALRVKDQVGRTRQLWYAPESTMTPRGNEHEFITHYDYSPNGLPIRIEREDVVHLRYGLDPEDPRRGLSPLASVLREVLTDEEAAKFTATLLQNMGVPGLLVSPAVGQPAPGAEDVKATKTYIRDNFTGDKRGEPLVLSGATAVQQFGFSPEQLELREIRRIPEERVTAVLGVPAIVAGLGAGLDRSTFSNMAEAREMAYESCIIPLQGQLGEELALQLMAAFEDQPELFRVAFDISGVRVLQEDKDKKVDRLDKGVRGGWIPVAYAQREIGIEPTEADDVYLRSFNVVAVPVGEDQAEPEDGPVEPPKMRLKIKSSAGDQHYAALRRDLLRLEKSLATDLAGVFERLGEDAAASFEKIAAGQDLGPQKAAGDDPLVDRVIDDLNLRQWTDTHLKEPVERHYVRVGKQTTDTINDSFTLGVSFDEPMERAMLNAGGTRAGLIDVEDNTRAALQRTIAAGRENQLGAKEIARQIRSEVPAGRFVNAGPKYRAELVARAETKTAQNVASTTAYKDAGIGQLLAFDARIGDEHDEVCVERDGKTFSIEDAEAEDLTQPNCSLSWAPVIP